MAFGDTIMAKLGLDIAGFQTGLRQSESMLGGLAGKLAGVFGVGLSVAGLEHLTKSTIESGARVYDLGERYKVSTDAIQKFGHAGELAGSAPDGMAKGFNKLDISISRALGGNSKILKSFADLGVTLDDLKSMSPEEIMLKLGKSSLDAATLVTILGKSALELRPALKGLADGTLELGGVIDKNLIKQLKEADDILKQFGQTAKVYAAGRVQFLIFDTGLAFKSLGHSIAEASRTMWDFVKATAAIDVSKMKEAGERAKSFAGTKTLWEQEMDKRAHGTPPDRGEMSRGARGDRNAAQLALEKQNAEATRIDDRSKMSLDEIAKRPAQLDNTQTIQSWFAGDQARKAKGLYAQADQQAANQDFAGARSSLAEADKIKGSITGLKESERGFSKADLESSKVASDVAGVLETLNRDE